MREQYSLAKILGIWALAATPMGILSWIVSPLLAPDFESDPLAFGVTLLVLIALGLVWLFVLSMIIVRREEGDLRWATVKRRLRLNVPREPATGQPRARLWLWVVPFIVAVAVIELVLNTPIENAWVSVFPFLAEPDGRSFDAILGSQDVLKRLVVVWWFLALFVVQAIFNTILGEEFLFRGVLLPRMEGVFGRGSWVANSVLFGFYHVHQPWGILDSILSGLLYTFPAYRYRSTWMSIILHLAQSVFFAFLVLGVVLGWLRACANRWATLPRCCPPRPREVARRSRGRHRVLLPSPRRIGPYSPFVEIRFVPSMSEPERFSRLTGPPASRFRRTPPRASLAPPGCARGPRGAPPGRNAPRASLRARGFLRQCRGPAPLRSAPLPRRRCRPATGGSAAPARR